MHKVTLSQHMQLTSSCWASPWLLPQRAALPPPLASSGPPPAASGARLPPSLLSRPALPPGRAPQSTAPQRPPWQLHGQHLSLTSLALPSEQEHLRCCQSAPSIDRASAAALAAAWTAPTPLHPLQISHRIFCTRYCIYRQYAAATHFWHGSTEVCARLLAVHT